MPKKPLREHYEVGYGKPPREHQFKPGVSPNPSGRPKKKGKRPTGNELIDMIREEIEREITIQIDGKPQKMPMKRAIIRANLTRAVAKGTPQSLRVVLDLFQQVSQEDKRMIAIPSEEERAAMTPEAIAEAYKRLMEA